MAVDFRCERCGKLLSVEAAGGSTVRCVYCGRKVIVPSAVASLPRPHVPPQTHAPDAAPPQPHARADAAEHEAGAPALATLAGVMPWVFSVFLHLGLFLVMLFLVMVVGSRQAPKRIVQIFDPGPWTRDGGAMTVRPERHEGKERGRSTTVRRTTRRESRIDEGITDRPVDLIGPSPDGGKSGADADIGLVDNAGDTGPKSGFGGLTGSAHHVVYVVDRSGSMLPSFDDVRAEILDSVRHLHEAHDFHIILFANNRVFEGPGRGLVPADHFTKVRAARFVMRPGHAPRGQTTALVALKRAFAVLDRADPSKPGRLIYLLTDGDFAGITGGNRYRPAGGTELTGNEAVLQWLRDHNADRRVMINTLLLHSTDATARRVLETIARDGGGRFKYISRDE